MSERPEDSLRRLFDEIAPPTDADALVDSLDSHSRVRRPAWQLVAAGALGALIVIGVVALWVRIESTKPATLPTTTTAALVVTSTTSSSGSSTVPGTVPPTSTPAEPLPTLEVNPLLAPFYSLPPCGFENDLVSWVEETLLDVAPASGTMAAVSLEEAMAITPLLRSSDARCVDSIGVISEGALQVGGWQLFDESGELIARAAAWRNNDDLPVLLEDPTLSSAGGEYHQDRMGSGQPLTGWVLDGRVIADTNLDPDGRDFVRFIVEIPGYRLPSEGRAEGHAGAELIGQLSLADLAPLRLPAPALTPSYLPAGYSRCLGPYWQGHITPIPELAEVTTYCGANGDTIQVGIYTFGLSGLPTEAKPIQVSAIDFSEYRVDEERSLVVGPIVPYGTIAVDAPRSIPNDDLVEMLESIPILDPGFLAPADGTHDLRPVFSEQWVVETLASTGATHIEVQSPPPNHPSSEEVVVRYLPAQSTREVEAGFSVYGEEGPSQFFDATEVRTHGNVTVLILRYPGAPAGQAIASCGGITINIRLISLGDGDPVVDAIEAFIDQANC